MRMAQGGAEGLAQVFLIGIEIGKCIVVAVIERQTLVLKRVEIALIAARLSAGNKYFGVFQLHIEGNMLNSLPAPARILESRQVDALLLEVTVAPSARSRSSIIKLLSWE
jgi:hypothetical protein